MLRKDWKLDQLSTIDVLAHLPKSTLRQVSAITTPVQLRAGKVLWEQGEPAQEAFLLLDGELELTWEGMPLESVRPGVVVGGVGLAEGAPRVATATTATAVEALVMSRGEYRQLLRLAPEVAGRVHAGHRARFAGKLATAAAS
jgi:CRP-like cAMP-binding protein